MAVALLDADGKVIELKCSIDHDTLDTVTVSTWAGEATENAKTIASDFEGWLSSHADQITALHPGLLELGAADETDMTWVNGVAVGSRYGAGEPRR